MYAQQQMIKNQYSALSQCCAHGLTIQLMAFNVLSVPNHTAAFNDQQRFLTQPR